MTGITTNDPLIREDHHIPAVELRTGSRGKRERMNMSEEGQIYEEKANPPRPFHGWRQNERTIK